jgi:hypothetical protein
MFALSGVGRPTVTASSYMRRDAQFPGAAAAMRQALAQGAVIWRRDTRALWRFPKLAHAAGPVTLPDIAAHQ